MFSRNIARRLRVCSKALVEGDEVVLFWKEASTFSFSTSPSASASINPARQSHLDSDARWFVAIPREPTVSRSDGRTLFWNPSGLFCLSSTNTIINIPSIVRTRRPHPFRSTPLHIRQFATSSPLSNPHSSSSSSSSSLQSPADHLAAKKWLEGFSKLTPGHDEGKKLVVGVHGIPNDAYEISMSRSSGPGGQNVNKVSTKATVRLPLPRPESSVPPSSSDKSSSEKAEAPDLCRLKLWKGWLPWFVIPSLWKSPYYASSPPSLLISASATRYAQTNRFLALSNLHEHIIQTAACLIVTPTSKEQQAKVKKLIDVEEGRKRKAKELRKGKKENRKNANWD